MTAGAFSQWLNGNYAGDNAKIEKAVEIWVDAYQERRITERLLPTAPEFVTTPSAERIMNALGYAQIASDIAVIYGGAGLGKTTSVEEYARANPSVWAVTMTPATTGVVPCLDEIAETLGIRGVTGGAGKLQRAIAQRLKNTKGLLVIDEAQHLSVPALDAVRALHDATGIGIALVGNEAVYARMTGGHRAVYLDRLYSRVGKRVRLTRPTKGDVDALIDAWPNVDRKYARKLLHEIAAKPGGLRGLTKVLRLASMITKKTKLRDDDVRDAWHELGGEAAES